MITNNLILKFRNYEYFQSDICMSQQQLSNLQHVHTFVLIEKLHLWIFGRIVKQVQSKDWWCSSVNLSVNIFIEVLVKEKSTQWIEVGLHTSYLDCRLSVISAIELCGDLIFWGVGVKVVIGVGINMKFKITVWSKFFAIEGGTYRDICFQFPSRPCIWAIPH